MDALGRAIFDCIEQNKPSLLIETLCKTKKGIEYVDYYLNTPLLWASHKGLTQIVNILLQFGAKYQASNVYGT